MSLPLKIATWNINSIRVRLPHILEWLKTHSPDILALQETKVLDENFPLDEFKAAGFECHFSGQSAYNGVAVISKKTCADIVCDIPNLSDPQRRILGLTYENVRIMNVYIPNGESITSEKYQYKLNWLNHLDAFLEAELKKFPQFVLLGDFNIAPEDRDTHDPTEWAGQVLCTEPERNAFKSFTAKGLSDCFRLKSQADQSFSWWDYRLNSFKRNRGMRIDHILASGQLAEKCTNCYIDSNPRGWERPSDHAPVIAEFDLR